MITTWRSAFLGLAFLALCSGRSALKTVTGTGTAGFSGDGGPASAAKVSSPIGGLAADSAGNLYIADIGNERVRKVSGAGTISTYAGNGKPGTAGDSGPALSAQLYNLLSLSWPVEGMAVDAAGNLYIVDKVNLRVRKVSPDGTISIFAGGGQLSGTGGLAAKSQLLGPTSVAVDAAGNVYIVDAIRVVMVNPAGIMTTVAGNETASYSGDGGLAINAAMEPESMAVDGSGNMYITDFVNGVIRKVDKNGIITTIAGAKTNGLPSGGDGGPATKAVFQNLHGVAVDKAGNIYAIDSPYLRKIDTSGTITTIGSPYGSGADGNPVPLNMLAGPQAITFDPAGNLYVAEYGYVQELAAPAPAAPTISANGFVNGASFQTGIVANSWVTIQGAGLAAKTDDWSNSIVNGALPTSLDGVSVTMGGKPAYVSFIIAGQLNVLAPDLTRGTGLRHRDDARRHRARLHRHSQCLWAGVLSVAGEPGGRDANQTTALQRNPAPSRAPRRWRRNPAKFSFSGPPDSVPPFRSRPRVSQCPAIRAYATVRPAVHHHRQHSGHGLWRRAGARVGRALPDRDYRFRSPSPTETGPFKLASAESHRRPEYPDGTSMRMCSLGEQRARERAGITRENYGSPLQEAGCPRILEHLQLRLA